MEYKKLKFTPDKHKEINYDGIFNDKEMKIITRFRESDEYKTCFGTINNYVSGVKDKTMFLSYTPDTKYYCQVCDKEHEPVGNSVYNVIINTFKENVFIICKYNTKELIVIDLEGKDIQAHKRDRKPK
jgi:hypothetical protein